jgi:two-component system sensor histidine kinase CpxA
MLRSRLFLRIFGWFWVALAGMLATLLLMFLALDAEMVSTKWTPATGNHLLKPYADEALRRYVNEGSAGLQDYIHSHQAASPGRIYVFDSSGRELTGQSASARVRAMAAASSDPKQMDLRLSMREGVLSSAAIGPDSKKYAIVVEMERRPHIVPAFGLGAIWAAVLALVVVALLCLVIAKQLAAPLLQVTLATRRLAGGDLSARALDAKMAKRQDEFAALARDFDNMAARIETLVHVQERLLWDISHELRSPLTRLSLALGMARRKAGSDAKSALDRIERETEQLNSLIEQLLTLARIKGGAGPPMNEIVDLAKVVSEVALDADFEARARNRLVSLATADVCETVGSRDLLKSAIENVVRNGIRHTTEGTEVSINLAVKEQEQCAVISIRDHGPGVPDSALRHLFDTFYRVPETGEKEGSGLGLAITQQAIAAHSGWVKAENASGGGLLVQLGVPLCPVNSASVTSPESS